jgi:WD40 repeat protein
VRTFTVHFAPPDSDRIVAIPWQFDPAGRLLVAGYDQGPPQPSPPGAPPGKPADDADQRLSLVDVRTGRMLAQTGLGDVTAPSAVGWSHDGRLLAVGTYAGSLRLLDAATLSSVADAVGVVTEYVLSASFAPDDRSLVIGSTDGAIEVFSVPDLTRVGTRVQLNGNVPDAALYAFYNTNGDIVGLAPSITYPGQQQWFTFPGRSTELLATACQLAGEDLTARQWAQYVPDQPYRHVCPAG